MVLRKAFHSSENNFFINQPPSGKLEGIRLELLDFNPSTHWGLSALSRIIIFMGRNKKILKNVLNRRASGKRVSEREKLARNKKIPLLPSS
jgi:hypothetical protein